MRLIIVSVLKITFQFLSGGEKASTLFHRVKKAPGARGGRYTTPGARETAKLNRSRRKMIKRVAL
jgi:hypothetical protein